MAYFLNQDVLNKFYQGYTSKHYQILENLHFFCLICISFANLHFSLLFVAFMFFLGGGGKNAKSCLYYVAQYSMLQNKNFPEEVKNVFFLSSSPLQQKLCIPRELLNEFTQVAYFLCLFAFYRRISRVHVGTPPPDSYQPEF